MSNILPSGNTVLFADLRVLDSSVLKHKNDAFSTGGNAEVVPSGSTGTQPPSPVPTGCVSDKCSAPSDL